ncbi:hypothetical protein ACIBG0_36860 [Nocardia sp. NPDC050630]|uniref:hypothetical protein n=1 Tax=Nocardia sp. NPDC050630 TaxID=3364321 RepID=UPI0037A4A1B0
MAGPQGPVAATTLPAEIGEVNRGDPDATARTVLGVWFAWNTNTDSGPNNAAARSAPLLSRDLVAAITGTAPVAGPGAQWNQWAHQHATVAVEVEAAAETVPPQTATEAIRAFVVTQSVYTPLGELIDSVTRAVRVVLHLSGSSWEVSNVDSR